MRRFEYMAAAIPADAATAMRRLNELGRDGWKLAHVLAPMTERNAFVHPCWFMRPAAEEEK